MCDVTDWIHSTIGRDNNGRKHKYCLKYFVKITD